MIGFDLSIRNEVEQENRREKRKKKKENNELDYEFRVLWIQHRIYGWLNLVLWYNISGFWYIGSLHIFFSSRTGMNIIIKTTTKPYMSILRVLQNVCLNDSMKCKIRILECYTRVEHRNWGYEMWPRNNATALQSESIWANKGCHRNCRTFCK